MAEFDFEKAVEEAKQDFPEQTKNVTFIDLDADDADQKLRDWIDSLSAITKANMQRTGTINDLTTSSSGFAFHAPQEGKRIVAMHSKYCAEISMFDHAPEKQAAYVFDHELGHIVVPEADKATNKAEHGADDFAVIRGLKRGTMDKKDIQLIADARATDFFLYGDLTHLTTVSLDNILVNPKNTDFLSLSANEIAQIAGKHAETFGKNKEVRDDLNETYKVKGLHDAPLSQEACQKRLEQLGQVCLDANKNSLQFYIAARIVKSAMEHGGINNMPLDTSGPEWEKIAKVIEQKTKGRDLGAKEAVDKPIYDPEKKPAGVMDRLRNMMKLS